MFTQIQKCDVILFIYLFIFEQIKENREGDTGMTV
jgi:hypothetical protein